MVKDKVTVISHLSFLLIILIFILFYTVYNQRELPTKEKTYMIVVARYNEDVSWTKEFQNVVIYNKGEKLEDDSYTQIMLKNVGREGHTIYTHIYNNYYNLTDYVVFLQGSPLPHGDDVLDDVRKFIASIHEIDDDIDKEVYYQNLGNTVTTFYFKNNGDTNDGHNPRLPFVEVFEKVFQDKPEEKYLTYGSGGQFIVSKKQILRRPRSFYLTIENLLNYDVHPIEEYVIERFHQHIFTT